MKKIFPMAAGLALATGLTACDYLKIPADQGQSLSAELKDCTKVWQDPKTRTISHFGRVTVAVFQCPNPTVDAPEDAFLLRTVFFGMDKSEDGTYRSAVNLVGANPLGAEIFEQTNKPQP